MRLTSMRRLGLQALLTLSATHLSAAPNDTSALGINLAGVTYWSSEIVFVDLLRHSQTFKSQAPGKSYGQGGPLDLTQTGWVRSLRHDGQFADSNILSRPKLGYPAGTYTCLYEGQGKIEFAYGTKVVSEKPGRILVEVKQEQNLLTLRITETNPSDPIRNIRMILPGWKQNGGTLAMIFSSMGTWSKWGSWGLMEYHGQPASEAPKYQAVIEFLENKPPSR